MESGFGEDEMDGQTESDEEDPEAAMARSRQQVEAKTVQELQRELDAVRQKLLRRSQIIDALRKAYLKDVVVLKNELTRKSEMTEEEYLDDGGPGTNITDAVPSLDMRPVLALFSPEDSFLRVKTCSICGGHLEIVHRESKRVVMLTTKYNALAERLETIMKDNADMKSELILTRERMKELERLNIVDRDALLTKIEQTKKNYTEDVAALKKEAHRANVSWRTKLARKEEELEVLPALRLELESVRHDLVEEKADREEDLHLKDGEIAALSSKVKDLESSVEASAKDLLDARNNCDELQRRLKAEETGHSTTRGLLKEQRSHYERCHGSLENAKLQLVDLNRQYDELRLEFEAMVKSAEDEALEANNALSVAKMEAERLRQLLGTMDTTKASDEAAVKELQSKLSQYKEKIDALEAEAAENRETLKRLEELEKDSKDFGSSPEFGFMEGGVNMDEDDGGLTAELEKAKKTIADLKTRQATITQELLGRIKGITAEVNMLRDQLDQVSKEHRELLELQALHGMEETVLPSPEQEEELQRLKEENAALMHTLEESSDAFKKVLADISRACKETRRTKSNVWNEPDLDRARSIPPLSVPGDGKKRRSVVRRRTSELKDVSRKGGDGSSEGHRPSVSQAESRLRKSAKDAVLEKKRAQKAAQELAEKLQKEEDEKEIHDLEAVCASLEKGGVEFAAERLEAIQHYLKDQFMEIFVELKQTLEMHKKFVLRSRIEARDVVAKVTALEAEINRLTTLIDATEEELHAKSTALYQTEVALSAEKDAIADLQRDLKAAQKEAEDNFYFKEKNASLQKNLDRMEISSRGLIREAAKAKAELRDQASKLEELRQQIEESEKRERDFKERYEALEKKMRETETELEERQKRRLEALKSSATQVTDLEDRERCIVKMASTQTVFHSPQLTLRRSNNREMRSANGSRLSSPEDDCFRRCTGGNPTTGIVCPTVDGWAEAAERDLYSPGTGSAAMLEAQSRPPAWDIEVSLGAMGMKPARAQRALQKRAQRQPTPEAANWGLWDDGETRNVSTSMKTPKDNRVTSRYHRLKIALVGHTGRQEGNTVKPEERKHPKTAIGGYNSPTRRLQNRIFLQSASDPSLCSPERRLAGATPPEVLLNNTPMVIVPESDRPKTSAVALGGNPRRQASSLDTGGATGNRPLSVPTPQKGAPIETRQVIDKGVLTELPRAKVWDEKKMAAAVAAAVDTGKRMVFSGKKPGVVGWGLGEGVVTRGGIIMDSRLANFRGVLRRDVFDAAERAELPMLQ